MEDEENTLTIEIILDNISEKYNQMNVQLEKNISKEDEKLLCVKS